MISIFYEKEGVSRLFVQTFCLTVPKNFVGERFSVSENLEYRKILRIRWGGCHVSPPKTLCLTVPKKIVGESFSEVFHKISGSQNVYG